MVGSMHYPTLQVTFPTDHMHYGNDIIHSVAIQTVGYTPNTKRMDDALFNHYHHQSWPETGVTSGVITRALTIWEHHHNSCQSTFLSQTCTALWEQHVMHHMYGMLCTTYWERCYVWPWVKAALFPSSLMHSCNSNLFHFLPFSHLFLNWWQLSSGTGLLYGNYWLT